jgi:hypothetical protein
MNAIRNLWNAFGNLTNAVNSLANVIDAASGRLRQQLALDNEPAPVVLEHQPAEEATADSNGTNGTGKGRKARGS